MSKINPPYRERESSLYIFFPRTGREKNDIIDTTIDSQLVKGSKTTPKTTQLCRISTQKGGPPSPSPINTQNKTTYIPIILPFMSPKATPSAIILIFSARRTVFRKRAISAIPVSPTGRSLTKRPSLIRNWSMSFFGKIQNPARHTEPLGNTGLHARPVRFQSHIF